MSSSRLAELVTPLYRGTVNPSTLSYLPTYREHSSSKALPVSSEEASSREAGIQKPTGVDISLFSLLEPIFRAHRGVLTLQEFVSSVVALLAAPDKTREQTAVAAVKLFRGIDYLDEGVISWNAFSHHVITRKLNESNLNLAQRTHADIAVVRVESLGANSGGVSRLRHIPELGRFAAMGGNIRALHLFGEDKTEVALQSPDRCLVNDTCLVHELGQLAVLGADHSVLLYDVTPMLLLRTRYVLAENHLCIAAVGKRLYLGSVSGSITEIDLLDGAISTYAARHEAEIYSMVYFATLSSLGTASADGKVLLWDLNSSDAKFKSPTASLKGHKQATMYVAFNSRHTLLITGGLDKDALVWNPRVEREPVSRLQGHSYALCGLGTRHSQIVTADISGVVKIWDASSFRALFTLSVAKSLSSLSVSSESIIAGSDNGKIFCIESTSNQTSKALRCLAVAVSTYTQRVFAATANSVYVYTFDGLLRKRFPLSDVISNPVTCLALTSNGRAYLTGHADGSSIIFSSATGESIRLTGPSETDGEVASIVATNRKVVIGSSSGLVRVLQVGHTKAEVRLEFARHTDAVVGLHLTDDETYIISAGRDGLISLFNMRELRQVSAFRPTDESLIGLKVDSNSNVKVCDINGTIVAYAIKDGHLIEIERKGTLRGSESARGFGVVGKKDYVSTAISGLHSDGLQEKLPSICRQILPFAGNHLLFQLQDGHILLADPHFTNLMYLGNALPLPKAPSSPDENDNERLASQMLLANLVDILAVEKPLTPSIASPGSYRKKPKPASDAKAFARLASSRQKVETVYRCKRLPPQLEDASDRVADALFDAGMDNLKLFRCNPRSMSEQMSRL